MWSRLGLGVAFAAVSSAFFGGAALSSVHVAGGTAIQPPQAPWAIYVTQTPGASRIACSGVILDSLHILTAAHCVYDTAGISGPAAKAAVLPSPNAPFPAGVTGTVAGYGLTGVGATPTYTLNELSMTVDRLGTCGGSYSIVPEYDAVVLCAVTPSGAPTVFALVSSATTCVPGSQSVFTYLGEPEILDFIKGSDDPPLAPRVSQDLHVTISETTPITVASTLTCASGPLSGRPTITYAFENAKTGQVLKRGASATWIPGHAYLHDHIQCFVFAKNEGGTTALSSGVSPALGPAPKKHPK
jgi:hypothetical protein